MARISAPIGGPVTGSTDFFVNQFLDSRGKIINTSGSIILSGNVYISGVFNAQSGTAASLRDLTDVSDSDVPVKNDVLKYNGTEWVFVPYATSFTFAISSFTSNLGSTTVEIGVGTWKAVGAISFTASYSNGPATNGYVSRTGWTNLTLDNIYVGPTLNTEAVSYPSVGGSNSFTLNATDGTDNSSSTLTYTFYNRRFWGVSSTASGYTESDVEGLANNELSNSRVKTFTVTAGTGEYIIYAYPSRLGTATFTVYGFGGGFQNPETVSVTNALGYTENYFVYRSTNSGLGLTPVVVS